MLLISPKGSLVGGPLAVHVEGHVRLYLRIGKSLRGKKQPRPGPHCDWPGCTKDAHSDACRMRSMRLRHSCRKVDHPALGGGVRFRVRLTSGGSTAADVLFTRKDRGGFFLATSVSPQPIKNERQRPDFQEREDRAVKQAKEWVERRHAERVLGEVLFEAVR